MALSIACTNICIAHVESCNTVKPPRKGQPLYKGLLLYLQQEDSLITRLTPKRPLLGGSTV